MRMKKRRWGRQRRLERTKTLLFKKLYLNFNDMRALSGWKDANNEYYIIDEGGFGRRLTRIERRSTTEKRREPATTMDGDSTRLAFFPIKIQREICEVPKDFPNNEPEQNDCQFFIGG